jgi:hypothetical protein
MGQIVELRRRRPNGAESVTNRTELLQLIIGDWVTNKINKY